MHLEPEVRQRIKDLLTALDCPEFQVFNKDTRVILVSPLKAHDLNPKGMDRLFNALHALAKVLEDEDIHHV